MKKFKSFIGKIYLCLLTITLTGCLGDEELPYSTTEFVPDSSIDSFEIIGGVVDAFGTLVMHFEGTVNDVEFNKKLDLIDECKFTMQLSFNHKVFRYDISEFGKINYSLSESEKCVIHYTEQLNLYMSKEMKNIISYK